MKSSSGTILVADDSKDSCEMMAEYLEQHGYVVMFADNGQEAIRMVHANHPDLILMDIQMPVMDGLEAIRRLKADPSVADIPIIALTALAMRGDRDRCFEAGADTYISKPVSLKRLIYLVESLLETRGIDKDAGANIA